MDFPFVTPGAYPGDLEARLLAHTLPFLAALLDCQASEAWLAPFCFQVFDDLETRRDPRMAKTLHGSLAMHVRELDRRNKGGAGVFLSVNETDGAGRSKAHIQALRAWWVDMDFKAAVRPFRSEDLPLPPSLLARSGHGIHAYWRAVKPYPCGGDRARQEAHERELKGIQQQLACFGADPAVCDVARVLRIPGFFNRKAEPQMLVELLESGAVSYTQQEIRAAFPELPSMAPSHAARRQVTPARSEISKRARAYAQFLAREAPAMSGEHGHRVTLQACIKVACGFDLGEDEAFTVLWEVFNPSCCPPWSEADLRRKVQEALKVCPERGRLL